MFSEMGQYGYAKIVSAGENRANERDVYRPPSGGMAHFSSLSPDSKWVLVVEMDSEGWRPCRVVPFSGSDAGRQVGPIPSQCTDAEWSPDGQWMYFSAAVGGGYHLWRQRFPSGVAEQITFGATEETGIAVAPDGRSVVTAVGSEQSTIWLHTPNGERQISSEAFAYQPSFSSDSNTLYYLVRNSSSKLSGQLTSVDLASDGKQELLPGIPILRYAVSPDSKAVVFTRAGDESSAIWISPMEKRSSPRRLVSSRADMPIFSRGGEVFFVGYEGRSGYIFRIKQDGVGMQKLIADRVEALVSISPDGRWVVAEADTGESQKPEKVVGYSLQGAPSRVLCRTCAVGTLDLIDPPLISWSTDQKAAYFAPVHSRSSGPMKTIVVPVSPAEALPRVSGIPLDDNRLLSRISGARVLERTTVFPSPNTNTYAIWKMSTQRNLYRISLP
jgi:Tol biopolymer transport system component